MTGSSKVITVGSSKFALVETIADFDTSADQSDFVLGKTSRGVQRYSEYLAGEVINNVFELGIWLGGSTAFFYELLKPKRLAAVDIAGPVAALESWIDTHNVRDRVKTFYETNQADVARLSSIRRSVFGDEQLDLVLDDASHMLEPTRTSFNALFPRLRPGGCYVIEDWAWAECFRGMESLLNSPLRSSEPMSRLIFEIVTASARAPQVVDAVMVSNAFVLVRKGDAELGADFNIRSFA